MGIQENNAIHRGIPPVPEMLVLESFPERLTWDAFQDFKKLLMLFRTPSDEIQAASFIEQHPAEGIRNLVIQFVPTPSQYESVVKMVEGLSAHNPYGMTVDEKWKERMLEERAVDVFGSQWVVYLGQKRE